MRILMIGVNVTAMKEEVLSMVAPSAIEHFSHTRNCARLKDGSEIQIVGVKTLYDLGRLQGQRYDFVIEHWSFPKDIEMYRTVQAYVLR